MRTLALAVLALGGCIHDDSNEPPGVLGTVGERCAYDSECDSGLACASNDRCEDLASLRKVQINWTIYGEPASATSCPQSFDLMLLFATNDQSFGFSPVPCEAGRFTIDKMPDDPLSVTLGTTVSELLEATASLAPQTEVLNLDLECAYCDPAP